MKPVRRVSVFESSCKVGKISSFIALLALLWLCPAHVIAQTETATISGQVTDASQSPVPNAPVVIRNEQTAQEFSVKTGENGNYVSSPLRPGSYTVSVELEGFENAIQSASLDIDQRARLGMLVTPSASGSASGLRNASAG